MTIDAVISRIGQIQTELADLRAGAVPQTNSASAAGASTGTPATAQTNFAAALSQAQAGGSATGSLGVPGATGTGLPVGLVSGGSGVNGAGALPAGASTMLTSGQQQFASRLAADTGLSSQVVCAWLLAEESGGAATSRQSAGNNDWLNIGYTDSGTYGSADSVWSDPLGAADATAGWLKGQNTIPGYGTASSGIQGILATAGQTPQAQIAAIQGSGWASSGYPDLPSLFGQVGGQVAA